LARGEGGFSYCLSEPDAGSDSANQKTRAVREGDFDVLNGVKRWISNAGVLGLTFGAPKKQFGIKESRTREVHLDNVRIPADRLIGEEAQGFEIAMKTPRPAVPPRTDCGPVALVSRAAR